MTAKNRLKAIAALALLASTTLAACGGGADSGGRSSFATRHAAAEKVIAQAIATNPKADSGRIDGTIDVGIKGVPRFKGTTEITANGVYNLPSGAAIPDFDIDVGLSLDSGTLGGTLVVSNGKGYIELGNAGYKLPDRISKTLVAPAPAARNGLTKTAAMFYINPQNWQKNAQLVGNVPIAGEQTQEIKADVRPDRAFLDLARLTHFLTLIHVTQALALPTALGPKVRAALVRSVTSARGEVWIGTSDHVLRKAHLEGKLVVAPRDRKLLYGATSATLDATINISDVGAPQTVSAPTQLDSYANLQLSLSALGEAARRQARRAEAKR